MSTLQLHRGNIQEFTVSDVKTSGLAHFTEWLLRQEKNHIAWVGISITAMAAVFFPMTMAAILFNGAHFELIIGAMVALALVVITNLADLPTRYSIPAFLLGIAIDIILIVTSFFLM